MATKELDMHGGAQDEDGAGMTPAQWVLLAVVVLALATLFAVGIDLAMALISALFEGGQA